MGPMDAHGWPAPRVWVVSVQRPICQALWGGEKDEEGVGARGSHCGEGSRELTGTVGTGKGKVGEGVYHLLLVGCGGPPPPPPQCASQQLRQRQRQSGRQRLLLPAPTFCPRARFRCRRR